MLGQASFEREVYGIDEVIRLSPSKKAFNPARYAFFAGSKSSPTHYRLRYKVY